MSKRARPAASAQPPGARSDAQASPAGGPAAATRGRGARIEVVAVAVVVAVAALLTAGLVGFGLAGRTAHPDEGSPEAGFARDMQSHHAQAVQMAMTIRDKTTDPTLRAISYDIATSQQQQAGQMYGWLTQWGLPQTSTQPPMAWMTKGHDMGTMGDQGSTPSSDTSPPRMPGMASDADLKRLDAASGVAAERLFLQLMIAHHRGGVEMAQALLERSTRTEVVTLAQAIKTAQAAEIEQMTALLRERQP